MTLPNWLMLAALAGVGALAIWQLSTNFRLNRIIRHYHALMSGTGEGRTLDQVLERIMARGEMVDHRVADIESHLQALGIDVQSHLQRVGMVRYNAFNDTGGDQSFALAVLDLHGNGAIINGLFHRSECRVYAKPVQSWRSNYSLSDEEEEAIRKARGNLRA